MSDYDNDGFEDEPPTQDASGPTLPGGISLQAAAALLLVAVLIATLYLFFGPEPETAIAPAGGGTARATSTIVTSATGSAATSAAPPTPIAAATAALPTQIGGVDMTASAPTLETGASSVTPAAISGSLSSGGFVEVVGTDGYGMRYRFGPGLDTATIRIVDEGEILKVSGGPEEGGGTMWWRLQDRLGNVGWAAADFLAPTAPQAGWSPPPASPTFESPAP